MQKSSAAQIKNTHQTNIRHEKENKLENKRSRCNMYIIEIKGTEKNVGIKSWNRV